MVKVKVQPEDFAVDELIQLHLSKKGAYTILKLKKRLWNTLDVIDYVARTTGVSKRSFRRAGLKDRYSLSTQYLSFKGNFKHTIQEKNFTLKPVGKSKAPIGAKLLLGNAFRITLRNLSEAESHRLRRNAGEVTQHGFPNYYDEQRFGSARHGHGFMAKKLILEHYAGALKLLMCYAYREDSTREKKFKAYCLSHWRDWHGCLRIAPPFYRPIIKYLIKHPKDFKNAIKQLDRDMLNIYLLAYQSYLFNEVLRQMIKKQGARTVSTPYSMGEFLFYHELPEQETMATLKIPMITAKTNLTGPTSSIIKRLMRREDITQKNLALQKMRLRGVRFKPFERRAIVFPEGFSIFEAEPDDLYPKRFKILMRCVLPAGTYATILIKRLLLR